MHKARERILKKKNDSNNMKENLSKFSKLSASNLVKVEINYLRKDIIDIIIKRYLQKEILEKEKLESLQSNWQKVLDTYIRFLKESNRW